MDAVVFVESGERHFALIRLRDEPDARAKSHQYRGRVRRRNGHALRTTWSDPTGCAVFLQAETDGFSPFVVLIVIIAPRVEAEVSAKRGHVSDLGRGDKRSGLSQGCKSIAEARVGCDFCKCKAGAQPRA